MKLKWKAALFFLFLILCGCSVSSTRNYFVSKKLTLAVYGDSNIPIVTKFNEAQLQYHIEIDDYSKNGTVAKETALARINAELAAGKGPDIFYLWNLGMGSAIYGPRGYLEDLLPYLDADNKLSREDFVTSLMSASLIDGKLYGTIPAFSVFTMFGPESELSQEKISTFVDLAKLAKERGGASKLFNQTYTDMGFLFTVLQVASDEFIDFGSMTSDFDNENFRSLLEMCTEFNQNADEDGSPSVLNYCVIGSFMELQYYENYYGEKITFASCPGTIEPKNFFVNIMDQYGINANSKYKDGAWSFIRMLFSEEYQIDEYVDTGFPLFPSNENALNALAEQSMTTLYDHDEEGNEWEFTQRGEHDDFEYHAATQAQVDQIMDLISSASQASHYTATMQSIIMEEAQTYFSGNATLDQVIDKIQNRVDIYLAEQS